MGLRDLAVAQSSQHFQHLAPGGERPAVVALVLIHCFHELDFVIGVIALAGGRIDLPAALRLILVVLAFLASRAGTERHRDVALTAFGDSSMPRIVAAHRGCSSGGEVSGNASV